MIWVSLLLVLGVVGVVAANMAGSSLAPGFEQMIHARVPWLLLLPLWLGCALGLAALLRRRSVWRFGIVGVEALLTALFSWYFLSFSFLPAHRLAVDVGEPFPAYALVDHEGVERRRPAGTPREPALYIFYRGDW